jgi:hypothetical protein
MTIKTIKNCYEQIREVLDELRSVREAAASYDEWKCNPVVARPWDEVDVELDAKRSDGTPYS